MITPNLAHDAHVELIPAQLSAVFSHGFELLGRELGRALPPIGMLATASGHKELLYSPLLLYVDFSHLEHCRLLPQVLAKLFLNSCGDIFNHWAIYHQAG